MSKTEQILKLSEIEPEEFCPECSSRFLTRSSVFDKDTALWDLHERCSVCKWSRTFANVRVG